MKKKRILFATNYMRNDTTSFLRAHGAFSLLAKEGYCEIVEPKIPDEKTSLNYGWWSDWTAWLNNIDVCLMHRPFGPVAAHIMSNCKLAGIPLWVDHDDDLLAIPEANPHYQVHHDGEKQFPAVEYSYKYADILTCSGQVMHKQLREKYDRPDAILITTGLDDRLIRFKQPITNNRKISWRGSLSHKSDLRWYESSIKRLVAENSPEREFLFWGINPAELWPDFKNERLNWSFSNQLNFFDFMNQMTKSNAMIHMVPLEDNHFNRVKSNLSWLDATLAGSVVLGPDFPEFQKPGIYRYPADKLGFAESFNRIKDFDFGLLKVMHEESWEYIKDNLLTSHLNKKRIEILRNL